MKRIDILGFPIDSLTKEDFLVWLADTVSKNEKKQVVTVYSSFLVWAQKNPNFAGILKNSSLNLADGIGLLAAADFLNEKQFFAVPIVSDLENLIRGFLVGLKVLSHRPFKMIPERLSGADLTWELLEFSRQRGWRVFLLGGRKGVLEKLKEKWKKESKIREGELSLQLEIDEGPDRVEKATLEETKILINKINNFQPHLLLVSFGPIKQEEWIDRYLPSLKVNVAMGVGGSFDLLAGLVKRAPLIMQKAGLEWFWRLIVEPRNLTKAGAAFPIFPFLIALERRKMIKSA